MPIQEILLMLGPYVTVPPFVILGTTCLDKWAGAKIPNDTRASAAHTR